MLPPLVDTHCHLTNARFADDVDAVVARAREAGVWRCQLIGTGLADARTAAALAARHPEALVCAAGLDPFTCHELGDGFAAALAELRTLLGGGGFHGLGEIGLEYHHPVLP